MRQAAAILLSLVAGCSSPGLPGPGGEVSSPGDLRSFVTGREFLSGGTYVSYGADGSYDTGSGLNANYYILGNRICVRWHAGAGRCDTLTREEGEWFMTEVQQRRHPFAPVESTLVGVGRVRQGSECPGLEPEFPAVMRLSRTSWGIVAGGRTHSRGTVNAGGTPMNSQGVAIQGFAPSAYKGFSANGGCTIDWDLIRS